MECKYAVRRQGTRVLDCQILKEKGDKWCACGNQRYCPVKQSVILTASAFRCPTREKYEAGQKEAEEASAEAQAEAPKKKRTTKKTKQTDKE
jgi:hypothetical protein